MAQRQKRARQLLDKIRTGMVLMKDILLQRFTNDNSTIQTNHGDIRTHIYNFTSDAKPTTKEKVVVNQLIRQNLQSFINDYISKKLTPIQKMTKDPHHFVSTLNEVWNHYQIFVFSHYHVSEKLTEFFTGFYRMNNVKDYEYRTKYSTGNEQVVAVPVMGVNELKRYFERINLIDKFKGVFNQFLLLEREGKNVPRAEIRESIHSLESCYFDMDAYSVFEDKKASIVRKELKMEKLSSFRRSKDSQFFNAHLMAQTLTNLNKFYIDFVDQRALTMNSTDQVKKMIEIVRQEEARALYYIHSEENRKTYYRNIDDSLIKRKLLQRLRKEDGFKKYLDTYDEKKDDFAREIKDLWTIYSRVPEDSVKILKQILTQYLLAEAEKVYDKAKKPPDFIEELIRINAKTLKIVQFCGNNFELENERNQKIRGMLSNDITQRGRKEGKFDIGAKNLASYINFRFKMNYTKGGKEALGETYYQLVGLFKILQQKSRFIDEQSKHLANRLLEQIQFVDDKKVNDILSLERSFLDEVQKECGVAEIRNLDQNIKDVKKSIEIHNKIKLDIGEEHREPLKQIIIKNAIFWPERSTYTVQNPPRQLLKPFNVALAYFKKESTNILFQFNSGVSLFQGDYLTGKKQRFMLKNLYMMILLFVEEEKRILFGNLKKKLEASGANKNASIIELARAVIELLHAGLLVSSTKSLHPGTPSICKINETDEFEINKKYDFVEQQKKKKASKGPAPKATPILRSNILALSQELRIGFDKAIREINDDQRKIEGERKFKVECIAVKALKHAHHHQMNCTFLELFAATQEPKNKQYRVNQRYLMEILEELINKELCQRLEGQRSVFRYIA